MVVSVRAIEVAVPPTTVKQPELRDLFAAQPDITRLGRRLIGAVFDASAIDTRHTVIPELGATQLGGSVATFVDPETGHVRTPSTGVRNQVYADRAPELFLDAAARALAAAPGIEAADVTQVVTVSCTGFFAPGPDYLVVRGLGLRPETERYHLGFMGCYGAFPALRMAHAFCVADPDAVVLVICAELCTIHLHSSNDPDTILASSVFADGAAAAVVSARPGTAAAPVLELDGFATVLTPTGETDMAWTIGDQGFDMTLSSYVPKIIERHIGEALTPLLAADPRLVGRPYAEVDDWAVHPGGRSILDRVQRGLGLDEAQLADSREVLRTCGNMSSATVLFILQRLLHQTGRTDRAERAEQANRRICALAFGPGLTVESALLTWRTG